MIRDAAAAFAADKLAPRIEEAYLNEKTDPAIFREMGDVGLLGVTIPEVYGGLARIMLPTAWWLAKWSGWTAATVR